MSKDLFSILEENNITLFESGNRKVAHCPFHEGDNTPSFTVYSTGTYFCFSCRAWGDAVKFLVDYKKMSIEDAYAYVGLDYKVKRYKSTIKIRDITNTGPFLYEVAQKYHKYLRKNKGALNYLYSRGLKDETINKYLIGYTDGAVLDFKFAYEIKLAKDTGLINENGKEILSHRIVIPNLVDKQVDYLIGRTVINEKAKYLGLRLPKPIFGLYEVRNSPILFVVEGQFDWLILKQWGFPAVVTSGTHLTNTNLNILKTKKVIIVPDNDEAGIKAAQSLKEKLLNNSRVLDYNSLGVKDIGELGSSDIARDKFTRMVKEQIDWIYDTSNLTLEKWFPDLMKPVFSL